MRRRDFVLTGTAVALAAGPAAAAKPTTAEKLAHVKSIGVISTIGQAFTLQFIGFTVFNNKEQRLPIEDWRIDERVAARIKAHLDGRFEVRPVEYDPAAFALPKNPHWIVSRPTAVTAVKDLPDQDLDAIILITPQWSTTSNYRGPFHIGGLGVLRDGVDMRNRPVDKLHAIYEVTIVDAETKAVLVQRFAEIQQKATVGYRIPRPQAAGSGRTRRRRDHAAPAEVGARGGDREPARPQHRLHAPPDGPDRRGRGRLLKTWTAGA